MRAKDASPDRNGSSQSSSDAISAASDTSGQGAPSPRCSQPSRCAQRLGLLAPWQQRQAVLAQRVEDRPVGVGARRRRQQALGQARSRRAAPFRGPARRVSPRSNSVSLRRLDALAERRADVVLARPRRPRRCARSAPCPADRRRRGTSRRPADRRRRASRRAPLDSTKRPRSPRAMATRSGQAWIRRQAQPACPRSP